jgi:hypothetical protein
VLEWLWPWSVQWWKPKDRRRDLVRAGALIVAEIERLDRAAARAWPAGFIKTDEVLSAAELMKLFSCGDAGDGPDLNRTDSVQVCDGAWKREPDGARWRFWRFQEG